MKNILLLTLVLMATLVARSPMKKPSADHLLATSELFALTLRP